MLTDLKIEICDVQSLPLHADLIPGRLGHVLVSTLTTIERLLLVVIARSDDTLYVLKDNGLKWYGRHVMMRAV